MIAPLKFTQDPVMRDDQPVHGMWAVIMTNPGSWGENKPRIHDWFDTREKAEEYASMLDRSNYSVLAIAQVVYQDGDHIDGYDPRRIEKRLEAERREREIEAKKISQQYRSIADLNALVHVIGPEGVNHGEYRGAYADAVVDGWAEYRREVEPIVERARVEPGDGIKAALKAKKANRRIDTVEQSYRHLNEAYRRSAAMRNGPSKRGQR